MFTTEKAICEMTVDELEKEYEYCMVSADTFPDDKVIHRYFRDRAAVCQKYIDELKGASFH